MSNSNLKTRFCVCILWVLGVERQKYQRIRLGPNSRKEKGRHAMTFRYVKFGLDRNQSVRPNIRSRIAIRRRDETNVHWAELTEYLLNPRQYKNALKIIDKYCSVPGAQILKCTTNVMYNTHVLHNNTDRSWSIFCLLLIFFTKNVWYWWRRYWFKTE